MIIIFYDNCTSFKKSKLTYKLILSKQKQDSKSNPVFVSAEIYSQWLVEIPLTSCGVELGLTGLTSTSQTIRTSFFYDAYVGLVQWSISNRDVSHTMELNSTSQKWRAFPETSAERCTFLPVFQSNVPFLSVRSRILCS